LDDTYRYRGFISYSRKDEAFAKKLHRALEKYARPRNEGGGTLGRFFRDEDDLSGGTDVGATLKGALSESEALIVICSPDAAKSFWVDQEIRHFCGLQDDPKVIACIISGTPGGDPDASSEARQECFPPTLRGGNMENRSGGLLNPLALSLKAEGFERMRMKVIARLLDLPFDDLWRREKRALLSRTAFAVRNWLFGLLLAAMAVWFIVELGNVINSLLNQLEFLESQLRRRDPELAQELMPHFFGLNSTSGTGWMSDIFQGVLLFVVVAFLVSFLFHTARRRLELQRGWSFIAVHGTLVFVGLMAFYFFNEGLSVEALLQSPEPMLAASALSAAYLCFVEGVPALVARIINFRSLN